MRLATAKLMDDVLRIELRCTPEGMTSCANVEIEITKMLQGVSVMTWPDGATIGRKRCTAQHTNAIIEMLRDHGWDVSFTNIVYTAR